MHRLTLFLLAVLILLGAEGNAQGDFPYSTHTREKGSKQLDGGGNWILERINDTTYVYKRYRRDTRVITHVKTFNTKKLETLHGPYLIRYDDGTVQSQGWMVNGQREGEWVDNVGWSGRYANGERVGTWVSRDDEGRIRQEENYVAGQLDGGRVARDSSGAVTYEEVYAGGHLVATTRDTTVDLSEQLPQYPGCEDVPDREMRKKCSDRAMLEHIYHTVRYPRRARQLEIQGESLVAFVVEKDGSITEVTTLLGVSEDIEKEVYRIIATFPRWHPGLQGGKPVRVRFELPVNFKLN